MPGDVVDNPCITMPKSLLCDPMGKMPMSIKDTGLFPMAPDLSKHSDRLIEYVPDPPLWSDGMEKQRFLLLPVGKKVDNTDRMKWEFPAGTIFIKHFFDDGGAGGKQRAIETRFIRTGAGAPYDFYVYKWNPENTDATLVVNDIEGDPNKDENVMITIKHTGYDGKPLMVNNGAPFPHTLALAHRLRRLPRSERHGHADVHRVRRAPPEQQVQPDLDEDAAAGPGGQGASSRRPSRRTRRRSPTARTTAGACCASSASCSATACTATTVPARPTSTRTSWWRSGWARRCPRPRA